LCIIRKPPKGTPRATDLLRSKKDIGPRPSLKGEGPPWGSTQMNRATRLWIGHTENCFIESSDCLLRGTCASIEGEKHVYETLRSHPGKKEKCPIQKGPKRAKNEGRVAGTIENVSRP